MTCSTLFLRHSGRLAHATDKRRQMAIWNLYCQSIQNDENLYCGSRGGLAGQIGLVEPQHLLDGVDPRDGRALDVLEVVRAQGLRGDECWQLLSPDAYRVNEEDLHVLELGVQLVRPAPRQCKRMSQRDTPHQGISPLISMLSGSMYSRRGASVKISCLRLENRPCKAMWRSATSNHDTSDLALVNKTRLDDELALVHAELPATNI